MKFMKVDLKKYRETETEIERITNLIGLLPKHGGIALDAGAREGFFSVILTDYFDSVIALDLSKPNINHEKIILVKGDITNLEYQDNYFDIVVCTEVLEHIPSDLLETACSELSRISKKNVLIGFPYKQDTRLGKTTCSICGKINPIYGHVNTFNEKKLDSLFSDCRLAKKSYVGKIKASTNFISAYLMNYAGNPYGSYSQEEPCIECGSKLKKPEKLSNRQKFISIIARSVQIFQKGFIKPNSRWIHVLYEKSTILKLY